MIQRFRIIGQVTSPVFPIWITRHARKLGLRGRVLGLAEGRLDLVLSGPEELLDAMALACSLGPQEVWVEEIERDSQSAQGLDNFGAIFG